MTKNELAAIDVLPSVQPARHDGNQTEHNPTAEALHQTEAALRESEARLRLALDVAELGTWEWELATNQGRLDRRGAEIVGLPPGPLADIATAQRAVIHPNDLADVEAAISAGLAAGRAFPINYRVIRPDATVHYIHSRARVITDDAGRPIRLVGTNRDVTIERATEIRQSYLLRLSDALRPLAQADEIQTVATCILGEALAVDGVSYANIEPDDEYMVIPSAHYRNGKSAGVAGRYRLQDYSAFVFPGIRDNRIVAINDTQTLPEASATERANFAASAMRACIFYPLVKADKLVALLLVTQATPRLWTTEEIDLVAETAERTWAAVERASAEAALQRLNATLEQQVDLRTAQVRALASELTMAEQEERRRISQILHDDLQQLLYGIQMRMVGMMSDIADGNLTKLAHYMQEVYNWMGKAVQTTRQLTVDLSPPVLKHEGLTDTLRWLVTQMATVNSLQVDLRATEPFPIANEEIRVLLFQSVRELLFNVVKHAGANHATVELQASAPGELMIIIQDEGRGFDVTTVARKQNTGFGLFSVHERLKLFGGRMELQSAPNQGTRVTLWAPVVGAKQNTSPLSSTASE